MANFSVTPDSVRAGAGKIGTESALVSGLAVPDPAAAAAGPRGVCYRRAAVGGP